MMSWQDSYLRLRVQCPVWISACELNQQSFYTSQKSRSAISYTPALKGTKYALIILASSAYIAVLQATPLIDKDMIIHARVYM